MSKAQRPSGRTSSRQTRRPKRRPARAKAAGRKRAAGRKNRLSRGDWVEGALHALAEGGLPALGVEALAERLGVTKGSFYWHFQDSEELLRAVVERWEELAVDRVMADLVDLKRPCEVIRRIIERTVDFEEPQRRLRYRVEVVAAALAESHPVFRPAYVRISERRLSGLCMLYLATGLAPEDATRLGRAAYVALLGVYPFLLSRTSVSRADRQKLVADLCERLLPPPCDA
ncbi:MAG TPA: TetR/AcrR family transcriptional regulator [Polyangiaceae bacterium]